MHVRGVQCDVCNTIHTVNDVHDHLPDVWMTLLVGKEPSKHFCSVRCLNQWIKPKLTANDFRLSDFYR